MVHKLKKYLNNYSKILIIECALNVDHHRQLGLPYQMVYIYVINAPAFIEVWVFIFHLLDQLQ
jgi:hypothetical protein